MEPERMSPAEEGELELVVEGPQSNPDLEAEEFSFVHGRKVGDAATEAAEYYDLSTGANTWTFKLSSGDAFDPEKPLASTELDDGDTVYLTDIGRGV